LQHDFFGICITKILLAAALLENHEITFNLREKAMKRLAIHLCVLSTMALVANLRVDAEILTDPGQLSVSNTVVDFESFGSGSVANPLVIGDVTFSSSNLLDIWDISGFPANGTFVSGKTLRSAVGNSNYVNIRIDFPTDVSEIGLGWFDSNFEGNILAVYDSSDNLLESAPIPTGPINGVFATFRGIRRAQNDISYAIAFVSNSDDVFSLDNVSYGVTEAPVTVPAESLTVAPGILNAGGLPELENSDNQFVQVFRNPSSTTALTQFVITGTSPTATPSALEFMLEGRCVSRPNVVQRIELYNYVNAGYEIVDERNANRTPNPDITVVVTATGDLSRYVDPTTLEMQARVRYRADIPRAGFASNTDQASWTVTP
jgi:hypothetical protein